MTQKNLAGRILFPIASLAIAVALLYPLAALAFRFWHGRGLPELALVLGTSSGGTISSLLRNTFLYALVSALVATGISTLVAYGFARIAGRGRKILYATVLASLLLPPSLALVPQYLIFQHLGLAPGWTPLLIQRLFGEASLILIFVQFIRTIPYEYDEAALLDGASHLEVFRFIVLPLARPAVVTGLLYELSWFWNELYEPIVYLSRPDSRTLGVELARLTAIGTSPSAILSLSLLALLPMVLLYLVFQRRLIQGAELTRWARPR